MSGDGGQRGSLLQKLKNIRQWMREHPVLTYGIGFVVGTVGYVVIAFGWEWWETIGISPVENADGTIDYTLVDKKVTNLDASGHHREDWVLRFSKDLYVNVPKAGKQRKTIINGMDLTGRTLPNRYINFILDFPDLTMRTREHELSFEGDHGVWVMLRSNQRYYAKPDPKKGGYATFVSSDGVKYGPWCAKDKEVYPGVIKLREATRTEREEKVSHLDLYFGVDYDTKCIYAAGDRDKFEFFDDQGKKLGTGDCDKSGKKPSCSFRLWLPQERIASVTFATKNLKMLPKIYSRLVEVVSDATVVEQSNINWGRKSND